MSDPWAEMDDWLKAQAERVSSEAWRMLSSGMPLDHPEYRVKLGESGAYYRMRSYIHGARINAASPDGTNAPSAGSRE